MREYTKNELEILMNVLLKSSMEGKVISIQETEEILSYLFSGDVVSLEDMELNEE